MKTLINKLLAIFAITLLISCEAEDKVIDQVFQETKNGAILREVSNDGLFDLFDSPSNSKVTVVLEYQDNNGSSLDNIKNVSMTISYTDATDPTNNVLNVPMGTVAGWAIDNTFGLPRATVEYTFADALSLTGVDFSNVEGGDRFTVDFKLESTEGTFGPNDANGNIGAVGGWYSSPYRVGKSVVCLVDDSFATGKYQLAASADFFGVSTFSSEVTLVKDGEVGRKFVTDYIPAYGFLLERNFIFDLVCGETLAKSGTSGLACSGVSIEWSSPKSKLAGTFDPEDDSVITIIIDNNTLASCGAPVQSDVVITLTKIVE